MIRHALIEGWLLIRQRWIVSLGLVVALAVPIALAGLVWSLTAWLEPLVQLADSATVVPVLLHPQLDEDQRARWLTDQLAHHPGWQLEVVSPEELTRRLARWFPYLEEVLDNGGPLLPPLVEITTEDPDSVAGIADSPAVLAIGPRTSIQRSVGKVARNAGWSLTVVGALLLAVAGLFAAVWVHLELYRHDDEIAIMRLVGATESTIRGPFVVAILLPAATAVVVAVILTVEVAGRLSTMVGSLGLPGLSVPASVLLFQGVIGCGLPFVVALVTFDRHADREPSA